MKTRRPSVFFPVLSGFFLMVVYSAGAEQFRFQYTPGDSYRILSTVQEDVLVNGYFDHYAEIVNRISVNVTDVTADGAEHDAVFMTTENSTAAAGNRNFTWGNEYRSIFTRDEQGKYTIDSRYYMPVVRNVPVFPEYDVQPGDSWTAEGHEAHDMRQTFNIEEPFIVPFSARYTYTGDAEQNGRRLQVIEVRYNLYYDSPEPPSHSSYSDYPATTMGYSHQTIYWDNEKGAIDHYYEDFRIIVETYYGNVLEFTGTAQAEVTEYNGKATERIASVQNSIREMGLENTSVRADEEGLTISIENIQFKPDSAELMESEKEKLRKIASILKDFPDNDLLVTGHTALAGTAAGRKELSEQRAQAVAEYLTGLGVKDAYHIFTRGFGAERPVAPNTTEDGKARNRRVEITIMDN